jgi:multiple sugar transport system ATP-binding protein
MEAMTLATRICLIDNGVLQQSDAPLTVYNTPNNLFVADFVGNPTMNMLKGKAVKIDDTHAEVEFLGHKVKFESEVPFASFNEKVVVGIRPEFVQVDEGPFEGEIYATLPAGMETTVKLLVNNEVVTSMKFGAVDYQYGSKVKFDITGNGVILFDADTTERFAMGKVTLIK